MVLSIIYTRIHLQAGSRLWCGYGSGMIRHRSRKQEHTKPEPYAMRDSSYIWCKLGSPSILTAVKGCVSVIAYCFYGLRFVIYQLYLCIIFFFLLSIGLPLIEPIYFYRRKWLKYNSLIVQGFLLPAGPRRYVPNNRIKKTDPRNLCSASQSSQLYIQLKPSPLLSPKGFILRVTPIMQS